MINQTGKERKLYFDILRIIAITCVIYNHTNEYGYYRYAIVNNQVFSCLYAALGAFIAIGVPLFFMISGALLLGKEESLRALYEKRVLRIIMVMVIFETLTYIYKVLFEGAPISISFFLNKTISDNIIPPYWYLYAYLAFLMGLPLLRKMVLAMSQNDFVYLIVLQILIEGIFSTIVYLGGITSLNSFFVIPFFNRVIFFPIFGYYMANVLPKEKCNTRGVYYAIAASLITIIIFVVMTKFRNLPYEEFTTYDKGLYTCGLTTILDGSAFYIVRTLTGNRVNKFVSYLGSLTFGVYLVEERVRVLLDPLVKFLVPLVGYALACLFYVCAVLLVSFLIAAFLKALPGLRKLL